MMKYNVMSTLILIFLMNNMVYAENCKLNINENDRLNKIMQKIELSENDIELFNLIPNDYSSFSKMFLYLEPIEKSPMTDEAFRRYANKIVGVSRKCNGDYSGGANEFFTDIFLKISAIDKEKWIEKSLSIQAGPWTADWIYEPFIGEVVKENDPVLHKVLLKAKQEVLVGLIIRYNTTNSRYRECEEKSGLNTICPTILPYYTSKMPKNIQKRFEKAKDALLK